jgi:hypothetical protein
MATPAETLVKYFSGPMAAPKSLDIAKFILLNAATDKPLGPGTLDNGGNEPSLMGRVFDILSRPNYAVAEAVRNPGNRLAFFEGLSGRKKTTFSDVLEHYGVEDPAIRAGTGFVLDVGLDPTTYIPGGLIAKGAAKAGKAVGVGGKTARGLDASTVVAKDKNLAQRLLDKGEPVFPEAFGLEKAVTPDIPDILRRPEQATSFNFGKPPLVSPATPIRKLEDVLPGQLELPLEGTPRNIPRWVTTEPPVGQSSEIAVGSKGQIPFKFPDFNLAKIKASAQVDRAEDIVEKAVKGEPESLLRILPHPSDIKIGAREQKAAAELVANWDNTKATAKINQQFPETLNARQQVKLFYQAVQKASARFKKPNAPANKAIISSDAYKIYRAVEKTLEAKGLVPRIGTGENVRLSEVIAQVGGPRNAQQVLDEFGTEIKEGGSIWQAIQALRAAGVITEAKSVQMITEQVEQVREVVKTSDIASDGFMAQFDRIMKKMGKASARAEGLSPASVTATDKLIDFSLRTGKSPTQIVIEQKAKIIDEIVAKGRSRGGQTAEINAAITRSLEADLGKLPKWVHTDNKTVEFFMGRVATWWGQKDLRPLSLNAIGSGYSTAAARGHALDNMFGPYNQTQRFEALRLAQGVGAASTPETYKLATQIHKLMDNMVGQVSGQSVVLRSAVHMDMLNKWMTHYRVGFEFTNKTSKNISGQTVDYSKGTDWLNGWKTAEVTEDPKVFLFKLQQAMEQATREKALFDEIGERFGAKAYGKGFRTKIERYPYLEGYYFPDDIAKQIPRVVKDWSLPDWKPQSPVIKLYDRVLSMWKSGVTIYRPAHHIRNMVGDVYLGWMDGVNSVRPYILAARVQKSMQGAYDTIEDVDRLVQTGILSSKYQTPVPGKVLFKNKSGVTFTAEQIGAVAHQKGLLEHARTLEDIIDMGEQSKFRPFGGKVQKVARGASELQNHNARLAHFIDKVMKSRGSDLEQIFEQASRRARKWHPSGLDLTDFEKNVMRRIIPFYSWMRKSLPLLIEGLVMNPGKSVIPAKLYDAIQESQGIETPGRSDPFPVDQMFPEWIRAQGVGPISTSTGFLSGVSDQMPPGYAMGGMGLNPLSELMTQIESPGRTITSAITPAAKIPIELMTGSKLFTGEPISGPEARPGAMEQYVGEQIPIYSAFQGITGITPFGTETKRASRSSDAGFEAFMNWLTGAGIKGTGPYIRQGQYERMAPVRAERKAKKDELLKYLREQLGS